WLATTRPDGRSHAVPVWFVWRDPAGYGMSGRTFQKAVNLRHRAGGVAHLGDGDDAGVLEGPGAVVTGHAELEAVDGDWSRKYVDPGTGTRDTVRAAGADLWRLDPVHVMTWAYGDIGNRTDWRRGTT